MTTGCTTDPSIRDESYAPDMQCKSSLSPPPLTTTWGCFTVLPSQFEMSYIFSPKCVVGPLLSRRNKLGLDFVCVDSTICMHYVPELNTPAFPQAAQLWVSSHRHRGAGFSTSFSELHQAPILHPARCSTSLSSIHGQPTITTCNNAKPSKSQDHLGHCFPSYEEILLYAFTGANGR